MSDYLNKIEAYAKAYEALEEVQHSDNSWMPPGDQKTGCIGEYYAFVYLKATRPDCTIKFGNHSQKGWDIEVNGTTDAKIQVKTTSSFSKGRKLTPIHDGWDELFIFYLNRSLRPEGFWIIDDPSIIDVKTVTCGDPERPSTGSDCIDWATNEVDRVNKAVEDILHT